MSWTHPGDRHCMLVKAMLSSFNGFLADAFYRYLTCFLLAFLAACSNPDIEPPMGESIPPDPLFVLLDAFKGNEQYFLRYRRDENIYYATGDFPVPAIAGPTVDDRNYDTPLVAPMASGEPESWDELTANLTPIPVLDVQDWASLREQLFGDLLPREENKGVAISFDRVDYFLFYDKAGNFRARRLIDMPPWYSVARRIDLRQHFEGWQPLLKAFLLESGIESEDVIFSTGDLDRGSVPFLSINTRSKLIVLVQYDDLSETTLGGVPGIHVLQSFWHVFQSHTYTILMRPFSTVQSLLSVVSDTAVETGRALIPNLVFDGPVPPVADHDTMDLASWEAYLDEELGRSASRGELKFLVDGEAFFTRFVDVLASARESIDIRAYIFDNDDVALSVGELLKRRSREGVDVRVLFDGLGSIGASGAQSRSLPDDHQHPLSIENYLTSQSNVQVRKSKNPWLTGDHVKTMIIDRELAYSGGMNIGREYRYDWHVMMVEIRGPVLGTINREFAVAWGRAGVLGDFS